MGNVSDSVTKIAKKVARTALGGVGAVAPFYDPIQGPVVKKGTEAASQEIDPTTLATPDEAITPVTPMPIPGQDDLANIAARRRSIQAQLLRRGRLSTILSQPQTEPLGG